MDQTDHASPDYGSDGDSVIDEHEHELEQDHDIKAESDASPTNASGATGKNPSGVKGGVHLQKRRRVTRACDECRRYQKLGGDIVMQPTCANTSSFHLGRKKIKCDGKQPCTHCTVYSYGKAIC